MARPPTKELVVVRSTQLTEHMLRITLGGEQLAHLPEDQESAYIKLVFPKGEGERPLMRTYTIRHQRQAEIDVDFALHDLFFQAEDGIRDLYVAGVQTCALPI